MFELFGVCFRVVFRLIQDWLGNDLGDVSGLFPGGFGIVVGTVSDSVRILFGNVLVLFEDSVGADSGLFWGCFAWCFGAGLRIASGVFWRCFSS